MAETEEVKYDLEMKIRLRDYEVRIFYFILHSDPLESKRKNP